MCVKGRTSLYVPVGATIVVVESKYNLEEPTVSQEGKQSHTNTVQYQLAGEMLAAALHNYQNQPRKTSHTIFGLRIIGMYFRNLFLSINDLLIGSRVTFCRADYPKEYLESLTTRGMTDSHITTFQY